VAESYELVHDFSSEVGNGHVRQMSKSADDDVFGFTTTDGSWNIDGFLAWRRSDDSVLVQTATANVDEVQVDKTGGYLVVKLSSLEGDIESRVVDLQTQGVENLTDGPPDYGPGHSDNGSGIVVGAENWENRVLVRDLATPHQFQLALDAVDWSLAKHVSTRAVDESWALVTLYETGGQTDGVFHDEIVLASTDGSGQVRRLAHHRSAYNSYWDSPRSNISRDGCFVAFTSNWGNSGRRDVFLLDLSP
jgi:hypothetical protein